MLKIILISLFVFSAGCETKKEGKEERALTIYQESAASWVRNFNPLTTAGTARWPTSCGIYEPLFIYNSMLGKYIPWLCTDYKWKDNNKTLIMYVRENVLWSDKTPFSSEDIAFTFNLKKKHKGLDTRDSWSYLKSVKALNKTTVEFKFSRIYVPGFDAIVGQPIVAKHIWEKIKDPLRFSNPNPVGTGPFTEILRFDNQVWELGKNPNYWQPNKPEVKKLKFPAFPSNEQVTLALISGDLDWAGAFIPAIDRVYTKKNPEHHKYWFSKTGYATFFYTNTLNKVLKDSKIRKAISYAIDRNLVVKVGMYNYTEPAHVTGISGKMAQWHPKDIETKENWVKYNPILSNQIFDDAGYYKNKNGFREDQNGDPLSFDIIVVSGWSDWIRSAQVIAQNLKKIGIKAKVKTYDFGAWMSRMQKGEFDMAIGWGEKGTNPFPLYRGMMSSKYIKPIGKDADANWHRFSTDEADSLLLQFEKTSDEYVIKDILHKLQNIFIDYAPAIPLFGEVSWAECNTTYFTNFPSENNPYAPLSPNSLPENLVVLVNLKVR